MRRPSFIKRAAWAALLAAGPVALAQAGLRMGMIRAVKARAAETQAKQEEALKTSSNDPGPAADSPRLKWAYVEQDAGFYYSSPAIGPDGTVYVGSGHAFPYNGPHPGSYVLFAFSSTGTVKWRLNIGYYKYVRGAPAIAPDGSIYFVAEENGGNRPSTLVKSNASGVSQWEVPLINAPIQVGSATPAIGSDGSIYVNVQGLRAFNPDGSSKWTRYTTAGNIEYTSPAIGADGTIYASCLVDATYHGLCAFTPAGAEVWKSTGFTHHIWSSPAIGADGAVYTAAYDERGLGSDPRQTGALFAFSSTGAFKWAFHVADNTTITSSPAIGPDGTIYFGTRDADNAFYAVNPDGTQKWRYGTGTGGGAPIFNANWYCSPAIGADGTVYAGNEFSGLFAFNPDGTIKWNDQDLKDQHGGFNWSSPAMAPDGTLYIGKNGGAFLAVETESPGLSSTAPWPRFHGNNGNDGRKP